MPTKFHSMSDEEVLREGDSVELCKELSARFSKALDELWRLQNAPDGRPTLAWTEDASRAGDIFDRARDTIRGVRQADYGDKQANFTQIAMGFQMVLARKLTEGAVITPQEVALMMIQVKIARLAHMPTHEDSVLDILGYAGCYDDLKTPVQIPGALGDWLEKNDKH